VGCSSNNLKGNKNGEEKGNRACGEEIKGDTVGKKHLEHIWVSE